MDPSIGAFRHKVPSAIEAFTWGVPQHPQRPLEYRVLILVDHALFPLEADGGVVTVNAVDGLKQWIT